jgi:Polymer-forming cytoskeletal
MASFFRPPRFLMRDRGAARTQIPQSRQVTCYRCAKQSTVSGFAESASCAHCAGNLRLLPINIEKGHWGSSIMTTESVHVHESAQVIANLIIASGDLLIEGAVHAMCICAGKARITSTAELKGGIRAAQLSIDAGAKLEGTVVESPSTAIGKIDIESAIRARPGTGAAAIIEVKRDQPSSTAPRKPDRELDPKPHKPMIIGPNYPPRLRVVR